MANIDNELDIIKNAPRGEDVRQAIIDAISRIHNERENPPSTLKVTHNTGKEGITGGVWDRVIVEVDSTSAKVDLDHMNEPIKDNGYYDIPLLKQLGYLPNENCDGINGFYVEVPQVTGEFGEINITQNGVYDPLLDGFDGYSKVYVNVIAGEMKEYYTVRFFDGTRLLKSMQVRAGTNAVYDGEPPTTGGIFTGWNPNPTNVARDMDVVAVYGTTPSTAVAGIADTIRDTWYQINTKIKAGQRPYRAGDSKNLIITYNGVNYILNMMLLGYNLDVNTNGKACNSTWININPDINTHETVTRLSGAPTPFPLFSLLNSGHTTKESSHNEMLWWKSSLIRALWNKKAEDIKYDTNTGNDDKSYYNAMLGTGGTLPDLINVAAGMDLFSQMQLTKRYATCSIEASASAYYSTINNYTEDKIWIPSLYEMCPGTITGLNNAALPCDIGTTYTKANMFASITGISNIRVRDVGGAGGGSAVIQQIRMYNNHNPNEYNNANVEGSLNSASSASYRSMYPICFSL